MNNYKKNHSYKFIFCNKSIRNTNKHIHNYSGHEIYPNFKTTIIFVNYSKPVKNIDCEENPIHFKTEQKTFVSCLPQGLKIGENVL